MVNMNTKKIAIILSVIAIIISGSAIAINLHGTQTSKENSEKLGIALRDRDYTIYQITNISEVYYNADLNRTVNFKTFLEDIDYYLKSVSTYNSILPRFSSLKAYQTTNNVFYVFIFEANATNTGYKFIRLECTP